MCWTSTVPLISQNREISSQSGRGYVIQLERAALGYPTPLKSLLTGTCSATKVLPQT